MKKATFLTAIFSLFLAVMAISAQEKTIDFSGNWELDAGKSKLGERTRIESMTMTVSQTAKDLKVETTTKRALRGEGETRGGIPNSGGMGRQVGGPFSGGDSTQTLVYSLEGKETKEEIPGIPGATSTLTAKREKEGKLLLTSSRKTESPAGVMMTTAKETWSLSPDGKILTVVREQETPRGKFSTEMVFNKKQTAK